MSTKEEIFNYVINSPENTNAGVLESLLDNLEENSNDIILTRFNVRNYSKEEIELTDSNCSWAESVSKVLSNIKSFIDIPGNGGGYGIFFIPLVAPVPGTAWDMIHYTFGITSSSDKFRLVVNGTDVPHDGKGGYPVYIRKPLDTPLAEINVIIEDKVIDEM